MDPRIHVITLSVLSTSIAPSSSIEASSDIPEPAQATLWA
jgi:hypothetical protein